MMTNWIKGTGVAVVTPFSENGEVDIPALRRIVDHLIAGGVEYLVALGTTGEPATLSKQEKQLVLETIVDQNDGRLPVILGVGGNNTSSIIEELSSINPDGPYSGILSVSPYYNKPTQEGIYRHYAAIAEATKLPIILYNVPGRTASNVEAATTLRLARKYPNIVAVKEASGNLAQCMEIIHQAPDGFTLVSGDDYLAVPLVSLGASGVISVAANAFPGPFSSMVRSALSGDFGKARESHYRLLELMHLNFEEGNPAGVKVLLETQGIARSQVRLPLVEASSGLREKLQKEWNQVFSLL